MLAGLSSVYEPGRRYSCRNGSRLVFRKQPGCCGSVEDHSSYIWVWKSEAVVYSLILLVTLGRSWTISNTTAILAALSSRSGHLQAWVGVMCPSWPRGMHSVSRVVHFEQQPVNCGFVDSSLTYTEENLSWAKGSRNDRPVAAPLAA